MKIQWTVTDLQHDGNGYCENGSCKRSGVLVIDDSKTHVSDLAILRRIKAAAGIEGMRADSWCCSDFGPWRCGMVGAYADIIEYTQ